MASLTAPARQVKPSRPRVLPARLTSCSCTSRPVYRCELLPQGRAGLVEINGEPYGLRPLGREPEDGYRLYKVKDGAVYDLDTSSGYPVCDCPDFVARRGTVEHPFCKHGLAVIDLHRQGVV
jgi:hypothetical protein